VIVLYAIRGRPLSDINGFFSKDLAEVREDLGGMDIRHAAGDALIGMPPAQAV